jgi:uncharacterized metal-binding protein YceD (DUF177 family)
MGRADHILRSYGLSRRRPTGFDLSLDPAACAALAVELGLLGLAGLQFAGEVRPEGKADFVLTGRLRARAVQACVVTLDPVEAVVDETITRRYLADVAAPSGETEVPEDVDSEPLPDAVDLKAVAAEALMLALPLYPRSPGAALAVPDAEPDADRPPKPFAVLGALASRKGDAEGS